MTDQEKAKLEQLNDDSVLLGILRKIFLDNFADIKKTNEELSDEILGQILRAHLKALDYINYCFKEIEKYKRVKIKDGENINPAR